MEATLFCITITTCVLLVGLFISITIDPPP